MKNAFQAKEITNERPWSVNEHWVFQGLETGHHGSWRTWALPCSEAMLDMICFNRKQIVESLFLVTLLSNHTLNLRLIIRHYDIYPGIRRKIQRWGYGSEKGNVNIKEIQPLSPWNYSLATKPPLPQRYYKNTAKHSTRQKRVQLITVGWVREAS